MKIRKYNNRKGYPRLSINRDNMQILYSGIPQKNIVLNIPIPGKTVANIIQPARKILSETQLQFTTIQQIKYFYGGIKKKEFNTLLSLAKTKNISVISLIETRLDVLLFRLNYARSIFQSQEFIASGKISIDNKICRFPATIVPIGSEIKIATTIAYNNQLFFKAANLHPISEYLLETSPTSAILLTVPKIESILLPESIKLNKIAGAIL